MEGNRTDDYSLYVFAASIVEQEGILLSENNLSGRVYFTLDEVPVNTIFITETNVPFERLDSDLFKIGGTHQISSKITYNNRQTIDKKRTR